MKKHTHFSRLIQGTAFLFLATQPIAAATGANPTSEEFLDVEGKLEILETDAVNFNTADLSFSDSEQTTFSVPSVTATPELKTTELAQAVPPSLPMLPNPEIVIESAPNPLQSQAPDVPLLPRAVAPPVGDIAISNIDSGSQKVKFNTGSVVIPRVLLREASVREVIMTLANYAGYNVVFTDAQSEQNATRTISLEFTNESVEDIFNSVLMISGLQANLQGRTIFVGGSLPQSARNLISRTLRLNQVRAVNAATFLAAQGAEYQRLVSRTEDIIDPLTGRVIGRRDRPQELEALRVNIVEGSTAPLLLSGLTVAADDRLNSVTLIGDARQIQIASNLLVQLDARRRQVVVNVKVIDINLFNTDTFNSSFSFGFDNGFFVQDGGAAVLNFGGVNPPSRNEVTGGAFSRPVIPLINTISGAGDVTLSPFFDIQSGPFSDARRGFEEFTNNQVPFARPNFGTFNNPYQPGLSDVDVDPSTGQVTYEYELPGLFQYPQKFLLSLEAQIESGNAKILTDPSIVVQEGQQATVKLTQKVIESVQTQVDPLSGVRTVTPVLSDSGLTLAVNVEKIDDNGFINLSVSPTIAAPGALASFDSGDDTANQLTLLSRRELTSGLIRLRDGQTLILSGIIQESDRTSESKVPILGDIPILGALFRSRSNETGRNEVIIILTPKILDDNAESAFGFDFQPGQDAAEILKRQGFPVQPMP